MRRSGLIVVQSLMFPSPHPAIYCLHQSTAVHPGLAAAIPPVGLLSRDEQAQFESFKVPKRRRDWLLGRWTAKHLVRSYLQQILAITAAVNEIVIQASPDGAPYARMADSPDGARLPLSLSISHSGNESFCAVCSLSTGAVGADIEQVEDRDLSFVRTFFTVSENQAVERTPSWERQAFVTWMWSAKEAVLKTLRLGLRADTRQVTVELPRTTSTWQALSVTVDALLVSPGNGSLDAWLKCQPRYVLSLALLSSS